MNNRIKFLLILCIGIFSFIFYMFFVDYFINLLIKKKIKLEDYNYLNKLEDRFCDLLLNLKSLNILTKNTDNENSSDIITFEDKSSSKINKKFNNNDLIYKLSNLKKINNLYINIPFNKLNIDELYNEAILKSLNKDNRATINFISANHRSLTGENLKMFDEMNYLKSKFGVLNNINGSIDQAYSIQNIIFPPVQLMEKSRNIGFSGIIYDSDGVVRRIPLVVKCSGKKEMRFSEIKTGDIINSILLVGYKLYNDNNNYKLIKYYPVLYSYNKSSGRVLSDNDLYLIKSRIDEYKNNLELDIEILKGKIEKNNREIINLILEHLNNNYMKDEMKEEINTILQDKNNQNDIDIIVDRLEKNFELFAQKDSIWNKEVDFFKKIKNKCINIDRNGEFQDKNDESTNLSLYDVLYNNKEIYYDSIILLKDYYMMSVPLLLISRYYNININDIEVVYGKEILLKNPMTYNRITKKFEKLMINNKPYSVLDIPIDQHGFLRINYMNNFLKKSNYDYNNDLSDQKINFENKIIILEAMPQVNNKSIYKTSLKDMTDVEIIANSINTILKNNFIRVLPDYLSKIIQLIISIIITMIVLNKKLLSAFLYMIILFICYFILAFLLFINIFIIMDFVKIIFVSFVSFFIMSIYKKIFLNIKL